MAAQAPMRQISGRRYKTGARPEDPRLQQQQQQPAPQGPQYESDAPPQDPRSFQPVDVPQGPRNPIGYNDTRDAYDMWQNERGMAQGQGDTFKQQFGDEANYDKSMGRGYDKLVPGLYGDIWGGGGGYTPGESEGIRQSKGLRDLAWNPQEGDSNYLSPTEKRQVEGSPYGAFDLWRGSVPGLEGTAQDTANMQRAGVNDMTRRYDDSLGATSGEQHDILGDSTTRLRESAGNPALELDPEYRRQAGMTDAEVQDTSNLAGQAAGAVYQRQQDDLASGMRAAGVTNPFGVAAARQDLATHSVADQADAAARARMAARGQQRDAAQHVEDTRLGAEHFRTGLETDTEKDILGAGLGVSRDIGDRAARGATDIGHTRTGVEGDIGGRNIGVREYNTNLGTDLYGRGETNSSGRALTLGTNRQNVNFANQDAKFNRGYTLNNTASGREAKIADQHQGQQAEGRAAGMGQQGFFGQQGNTAAGNQLRSWEDQMQGTQGASKGYSGWGSEQDENGFGSNFSRAFGSTLGKGAGAAIFGGAHADGGGYDDDEDDPMTVLSPEGSYELPQDTTVLPMNRNREISPNGKPNRFYEMGKDLIPKFKDLAYGPAQKAKQVEGMIGDVKNYFSGGGSGGGYADGGSFTTHAPPKPHLDADGYEIKHDFGRAAHSTGGYFDPDIPMPFRTSVHIPMPQDEGGYFETTPDAIMRKQRESPEYMWNENAYAGGGYMGPKTSYGGGGYAGGGRMQAHLQTTPATVVQGNHISSVSEEGPEILLSKRNPRPYRMGMRHHG